MMIRERTRLVLTAIAVVLVAVLTGLFLGGDLLPSPTKLQYNERTTTTTTSVVVTHSHDGLQLHGHLVTIVVTTIETTSSGVFHDFAGAIVPSPRPPPISQQAPTVPQITTDPEIIIDPVSPR